MRRAEGVVDEEVAALGELARELRVVLRLAGVEARVLEHLDPLVRQERAQPPPDRLDPRRRILALRPAEVRADADAGRAPLEQQLERRQRRADARVVGDLPVLERDVQVGADEDGLAARRPRREPSAAASFLGQRLEELDQVPDGSAGRDAPAPLRLVDGPRTTWPRAAPPSASTSSTSSTSSVESPGAQLDDLALAAALEDRDRAGAGVEGRVALDSSPEAARARAVR